MNKLYINREDNKFLDILSYTDTVFLNSCYKILDLEKRKRIFYYSCMDTIIRNIEKEIPFNYNSIDLNKNLIKLDGFFFNGVINNIKVNNLKIHEPTKEDIIYDICWMMQKSFIYKGVTFKSHSQSYHMTHSKFKTSYEILGLEWK